jgi:hypothetical protein
MENECKIENETLVDILHGLNNPLTNIRMCLEYLQSVNTNADLDPHYAVIKNSTIDMETTLKEIFTCYIKTDNPAIAHYADLDG